MITLLLLAMCPTLFIASMSSDIIFKPIGLFCKINSVPMNLFLYLLVQILLPVMYFSVALDIVTDFSCICHGIIFWALVYG